MRSLPGAPQSERVPNRTRIVLVGILALLEVTGAAASVTSYKAAIGAYGFLVGKDGTTIVEVERASPADRAAIVRGDRLVYATLPLRGRHFVIFQENVPGDAPITFEIVHAGRARWVTLYAESMTAIGRTETLTYALAGLAFGLTGLLLVGLRPSSMTWAFALIAPPLLIPWNLIFWSQQTENAGAGAFDAALALLYAAQTAAVIIFASRFPSDRPAGVAQIIDRLGLPIGAIVAAIYLYAYMQVRFSLVPPAHWISLANYAVVLPGVVASIALVSTYVTTPGGARTRLLPVIASFVVLIVSGVLQQVGSEWTASQSALFALSIAFSASPALVAAAVAYGVIRHRVMDVSFIISRTVVYTMLTIFAVAIFTLIEYVFAKLLERQGVATFLDIGAAIVLGISLNELHKRVDDFVDRVLFRRRHLAEERLARVARSLPQASTAQSIDEALVEEPVEALALSSGAVFRCENAVYRRVRAHNWHESEATSLDADDSLVLRLRTDLVAIDPHDVRWSRSGLPDDERRVLYAVPVAVGPQLEAIALYGDHCTGEDLDPDERRILRRLAAAAAAGYGHVATTELRDRLAMAQAENAQLRGVERKLTELLAKRLS
jgi:hypothetical protein